MDNLILIRHGQSSWNLENRFTGWVDVDLSENGVLEAKEAAKVLKKNDIEIIVADINGNALPLLKSKGQEVVYSNNFESRILIDMPMLERAKLMRKIADETRKIAKEGGTILCYENGKTLNAAIKEFNDVADMFDYYAGLTDKLEGKTIPVSNSVLDYTVFKRIV